MKVYINYNFCGYRWFVIDDFFSLKGKLKLQESIHNEKYSTLIVNLMTYDPYDVILIEENSELILAIRGIEDTREDTYNRKHLSIAMIFVANRSDFDLLHKIMLAYINHKDEFNDWVRNALCSDISDVIFDTQMFLSGMEKIKTAKILNFKGLGGLAYTPSLCFICSNWSSEKIASLLGIDKRRFLSSLGKLEQFSITKWIINPFMREQDLEKEKISTLISEVNRLRKKLRLYTIIAFILGVIVGCLIL